MNSLQKLITKRTSNKWDKIHKLQEAQLERVKYHRSLKTGTKQELEAYNSVQKYAKELTKLREYFSKYSAIDKYHRKITGAKDLKKWHAKDILINNIHSSHPYVKSMRADKKFMLSYLSE